MAVTATFTMVAWLVLAIAAEPLVRLFGVGGEAADLIRLFCRWLAPLFVFMGALFVANAAFNTLGRPHLSTALNWGRATVGTIPFVEAGAMVAGAAGVLTGYMAGGIVFGVAAVWLGYRHLDWLAAGAAPPPLPPDEAVPLAIDVPPGTGAALVPVITRDRA